MRAKTFSELRRRVHARILIALGERLRNSALRPTQQEISIGSFLEDIEMQVRDAVLKMNRMGYCTWSSGFYGKKSNVQGIEGPFVLGQSVIAKLEEVGAKVKTKKLFGRNYTSITFHPKIPDTVLIERQWKKLISLIPAKGYLAILPENYGSTIFWEYYVPYKQIETLRLQRLIGAKRNSRWMKQWKRQLKRLEK